MNATKAQMPLVGDVRINRTTHPVGTPIEEIYDFEIWDGDAWLPAATAHDIVYKIGTDT